MSRVLDEAAIRAALNQQDAPAVFASDGLVHAAVLIPLLWVESGWRLLFTRRTDRMQKHKGQVAFPGGARDPQDQNDEDTALRETYEEIGIKPAEVRLLGKMRPMATVTGFLVTPVVGIVRWPVALYLAEQEVSRAFDVPLDWLMEPLNRTERLYTRSNGSSEMVIFYEPFDGETIWGITGRIVVDFIHLLEQKTGGR